ncbi:MAG: signal peptidase II [Bdellovibrionales bacterium CG10_big_fil_rev_8_21_14_0_10_45_34]|nr:MAG: signal peptidase II [Bdellovibrionales bacterium CG10_big_fil_rev_8_21_14_0_10_45_34]
MNKRLWLLYVFFPLSLVLFIDQITKTWASDLTHTLRFGKLFFSLHHNYGAILGLFSDLPAVLRVVSLSTGGAFLVFTFFVLQYLLPTKFPHLRIGMSILLGGILGNVLDRILMGYVVDFIAFDFGRWVSPVFNLSDALQWVGYILIFYGLIRYGHQLWPDNDSRKRYWINPKFQLEYSLKMMAAGLGFSIIALVFSYTYFRVAMIELIGHQPSLEEKFLNPYVVTFGIVTCGFLSVLFLVGLVLSHRAAGPIFAFEKFLDDLMAGKKRVLKLRAGDEFRHLEELSLKLAEHFGSAVEEPPTESESDKDDTTKDDVAADSASDTGLPNSTNTTSRKLIV